MSLNTINRVIEKTDKILSAINDVTINDKTSILEGFINSNTYENELLLKQYLLITQYSLISDPKESLIKLLYFIKKYDKTAQYELLKFRVDAELGFTYKNLQKTKIASTYFQNSIKIWPTGLEVKIKSEVEHELNPEGSLENQRIKPLQLGAPSFAVYDNYHANLKKSNILTLVKELNQVDRLSILDLFIKSFANHNERLLKTHLLTKRAKISPTLDAIKYYSSALNLCPENESTLQDKILAKRGITYYYDNQIDLAIRDYQDALSKLTGNDIWLKAQRLSNLGRFYFEKKDIQSSIKNYKLAINMCNIFLESDPDETSKKKATQIKSQIEKFLNKRSNEPGSPSSCISATSTNTPATSQEDSIIL